MSKASPVPFSSDGGSSPEPAGRVAPWVPAHRLQTVAALVDHPLPFKATTGGSEGEELHSAAKPPKPRSRHQRRGSWHATSAEDVSALVASDSEAVALSGTAAGRAAAPARRRNKRSVKQAVAAIREASAELDPAVAEKAIATLSGTASAAAPAHTSGQHERRGRRMSHDGQAAVDDSAAAGAAAAAAGWVQDSHADGGQGGEVEGGKKRRHRQRRKSTGSRRQSLDFGNREGMAGGSPEDDDSQHHRGKGAAAGAAKPGKGQQKHEQEKQQQQQAKEKKEKKDYAAWAAATPEFRAEAAAARHAAGNARHSMAGATTAMLGTSPRPGTSPIRFMSLNVGGSVGGDPAHHHAGDHSQRIARGPDGTRGFAMGRGRAATPPPGAVAK